MNKFIDMIGYVPRVGLIGRDYAGHGYGNLVSGNFAAAYYFTEA